RLRQCPVRSRAVLREAEENRSLVAARLRAMRILGVKHSQRRITTARHSSSQTSANVLWIARSSILGTGRTRPPARRAHQIQRLAGSHDVDRTADDEFANMRLLLNCRQRQTAMERLSSCARYLLLVRRLKDKVHAAGAAERRQQDKHGIQPILRRRTRLRDVGIFSR